MSDYDIKRVDPHRSVKVTLIGIVAVLLFMGLCVRLAYLQLYMGETFRILSENNRIRFVKVPAPRGMFFDRHGRVVVDNRPSFDVKLATEYVENIDDALANVSKLTGVEAGILKTNLKREKDKNPKYRPLTVVRDLPKDDMAPLISRIHRYPALELEVLPIRNYVYGPLAPHLFGYMGEIGDDELELEKYRGYKTGDIIGKSGIEEQWDREIRGVDGGIQMEVDSTGRELKFLGKVDPVPGNNFVLTIDLELQEFARRLMEENDYAGAVIAMDPRSFEILAMVSAPGFDPATFAKGISADEWKALVNHPRHPLENKGISGQYPPGSTYKLITATAGLEEGFIDIDKKLYCPGYYRFGGRAFACWKAGGHGGIKIHRAIVESCDVFFYQVGNGVGIEGLSRYGDSYGFGKLTGIKLSNEKVGINPSPKWKKDYFGQPWYPGETISCSIGQGYTLVTPLQLLVAFSAAANGGTVYEPMIVRKILSPEGETIEEFKKVKRGEVLVSPENLEILKSGFYGGVNEPHGTGWRARVKDKNVCGKTGTAQVITGRMSSKYLPYELRDHAWFVAFAPLEKPEIAVVVLVEHGGFGGTAASPIVGEVIKKYFELKERKRR
ncbi:MAG: penicillin-binding protein 2 [Deltaproteobacteria bacterium]|uniref:Penicillin-binding protein 2 n=1 Tax=Candidatus Zymogenus saltonus TaxID=2844893 RepID=A0A9D8KH93_9DELT|nr:penicillin-binding protein 2 [Candidatus Zymogenus saltonus]